VSEIVTSTGEASCALEGRASVSLIIPALNEAEALPSTLQAVAALDPPAHEVVVVDGGSEDQTVALAKAAGCRVLRAAPGRARQMNAGAGVASGDLLCFLHADTRLAVDAIRVMGQTLSDPRIAGAGFTSLMEGTRGVRWLTSFHNFIKTYYAPLLFRPVGYFKRGVRLLFGDQAIFCRRRDFLAVGGFEEIHVMEEASLCERLSARGRILQLRRTVRSSDRRVRRWGFWRAHATYVLIGFGWGLGVSSERLRRFYPDVR
jgi:rSAM/selenodomain-associated transferase 2